MSNILSFGTSALYFLVRLGILVFIHELGHYLAARWRGVYVEVFSIGFGRAIATWTDRLGTVWKLGWLPLGGYVKLHGQERPEDVPPEVRASWQRGRTFHGKSVASRAIVIAAGPAANFLLAIVLFSALFAYAGRPAPGPTLGDVVAGGAAEHAGLRDGDRVTAIDAAPVSTFLDIQRIVSAHPREQLTLHVVRDGQSLDVPVTPDQVGPDDAATGRLGVQNSARDVVYEPQSLGEALVGGVEQTWDVGVQTLAGLYGIITGRHGLDELGGPLRIAQMSAQITKLGMATVINFVAVLSINLGLLNLFPIPILDGGHLLFLAAEALRGRPLPPRAQEYGFRAGLAFILTLFVVVTLNDLGHLGLYRWVAALVG